MNKLFIENSIGQLIDKLGSGVLKPEDLSLAVEENVGELDDSYHAFVVSARKEQLDSMQEHSSGMGLFAHIPIGVKDIYNTADFPTQMGSPL